MGKRRERLDDILKRLQRKNNIGCHDPVLNAFLCDRLGDGCGGGPFENGKGVLSSSPYSFTPFFLSHLKWLAYLMATGGGGAGSQPHLFPGIFLPPPSL